MAVPALLQIAMKSATFNEQLSGKLDWPNDISTNWITDTGASKHVQADFTSKLTEEPHWGISYTNSIRKSGLPYQKKC